MPSHVIISRFSPLLLHSVRQSPSNTAGHAAPQLSGLDLTQLEADVQTFFERGLAPSTTCTYQSAKRRYISFCQASNSQLIPLTEVVLCKFVVYLANQKLKHQTTKVYLSGLCHLHRPWGSFPAWCISSLRVHPQGHQAYSLSSVRF